MTINLLCRKDQVDKDGYADIIFLLKQGSKNYKISTKEKCKPQFWSNDSKMVSGKVTGAVQLNQRIIQARTNLESILAAQQNFDIIRTRNLFADYLRDPENFSLNGIKPTTELSFYDLIERIIADRRNEWSPGHQKKFRSLRTKIIDKDPNFKVSDISMAWWQDYVDYCFDDLQNGHNTIQVDLKVLHQLCGILKDDGHKFNPDIMKASMEYIEPKIEPLTWDEVNAIASYDLNKRPEFEDSRYLWVLCAYIGQRWKDMNRVNRDYFMKKKVENHELWYYTNRAQKGKKLIEIPLLDEAVDWLHKRNFEVPQLTQQRVNKDIKDIARLSGINQDSTFFKVKRNEVIEVKEKRSQRVHIHTARHSYAVELVRRSQGKPYAEKFVSEMLGHASPNTTWKYFNLVSSNKDKMFLELMGKK